MHCSRNNLGSLGLALALWPGATGVACAVIDVPGDQPTTQAAIGTAHPGDETVVAPGVLLTTVEGEVDFEGAVDVNDISFVVFRLSTPCP